jgi:Pectate lyase superfamily protein
MSATRFPRSRSGLYAITASLILLVPLTAGAAGATIRVAPPNRTDDTANIQSALDACVADGPGCTVQLAAGTYRTRQLVAYNFHGTFRGIATDRTTIEALPYLPVTVDFLQPCQPNTTTCLWPTLIIFVDGDISISDLSVHMTATNGTATAPQPGSGAGATQIETGIRLMGQFSTTNVQIDRVEMEGRPDITSGFGYNVNNGIMFTGELSGTSANPLTLPCGAAGGFYFVSGSYTVRNSSFKSMGDGVSQDGCVRSSHITIGGSPSTGNTFEDHIVGIDLESAENSVVQVSYNVSSATGVSMWVIYWDPSIFQPSKPSKYFIHDNKLFTTGQFADGIYLLDQPPSLFIDAVVWNNTIELQNTLSEGIGVAYTKGTSVLNNSITGSDAFDAIGLYGSTLADVINNEVDGVALDSTVGIAQIFLDPGTSQDLVLCATPSDTLLNQGTDNIVIRCQQQGAAPTAASANGDARSVPRIRRIHKPGL